MSDVVLEFAQGADIDDAAQPFGADPDYSPRTPPPADPAVRPSQEPILRIGLSIDANALTSPTSRPVPAAAERWGRTWKSWTACGRARSRGSRQSGSRPARTGWPLAASLDQISNTLGAENVNLPGDPVMTRNTWFVPSMKYACRDRAAGGAPTDPEFRRRSPPSARP